MDPLDTLHNTEPACQLNWGLTIFWHLASADHVHLAMGCSIDRSREELALSYLSNCAYACEMKAVFRFGYYVGTIGEYDRGAVVLRPGSTGTSPVG